MVLNHHGKAEETGSYIVGACGLDSIPNDVGVAYLLSKFTGKPFIPHSPGLQLPNQVQLKLGKCSKYKFAYPSASLGAKKLLLLKKTYMKRLSGYLKKRF